MWPLARSIREEESLKPMPEPTMTPLMIPAMAQATATGMTPLAALINMAFQRSLVSFTLESTRAMTMVMIMVQKPVRAMGIWKTPSAITRNTKGAIR